MNDEVKQLERCFMEAESCTSRKDAIYWIHKASELQNKLSHPATITNEYRRTDHH